MVGMVGCALLAARPVVAGLAQSSGATVQDASYSPTARLIVTYRDASSLVRAHPWRRGDEPAAARETYRRRAEALSARHGLSMSSVRALGPHSHVLRASGVSATVLAQRLRSDPDIGSVVVDQRRRALAVPNDPLFLAGPPIDRARQTGGPEAGQWYLRAPTALFRSATDVVGAWVQGRGDPSVVVAVLDTGVLSDHEDLDPQRTGRVLPGFDMVESPQTANDGDGRDADASDPGDWVTVADDTDPGSPYFGCGAADSAWHGTQVAGLIAAAADNGVGMAGVAPGARLLPVRVLGTCGGWDSDIIAGMYWAAGIEQPGLPTNPHPARILNLSLGGGGPCTAPYAAALSALAGRRIVVVAAAGNSTGRAVGAPANCPGVIAVTGVRHAGTKVGFADLGPEIAIAAPAGNCVNAREGEPCLYPLLSTSNAGRTEPRAGGSTYTDGFNFTVGTSFATPLVAGTVALMLSARPDLDPAAVRSILQASARPFPTEGADNGDDPAPVPVCQPPSSQDQLQCYCTTFLCGAGILDAAAALRNVMALAPPEVAPGAGTGGGSMSAAWLAALALAAGILARSDRRGRRGRTVVGDGSTRDRGP